MRLLLPTLIALIATGPLQAQFSLVETGGSFRTDATNFATAGTAFSASEIGLAPHSTANLNNGTYGNSSSWIGGATSSAGILFSSASNLGSFAFGRDNTGGYTDRSGGTYTLYYTTDSGLNSGNAYAANWTSLGLLDYTGSPPPNPSLRHVYNLTSGVTNATGFRIDSAAGTAIDEIELYASAATTAPQPGASNLGGSLGSSLSRNANSPAAQRFTTDASSAQFSLDAVTMRLSATGIVDDFSVTIMTNSGSNFPDQVVGVLTGPTSISSFGDYTFTASNLVLDASTSYWVEASFTEGAGYTTYFTTAGLAEGDWSVVGGIAAHAGGSWFNATSNPLLISLEASAMSAIPEPSTYAALAGLAALGATLWRRRTPRTAI